MIVQCDHCNTRFKLDDAKVKPGGVKVRCSKCKEVFLVKKEEPREETTYDASQSAAGSAGALVQPPSPQVSAPPVQFDEPDSFMAVPPPAADESFSVEQTPAADFSSEGFAFAGEEPSSFEQSSFAEEAPASTETAAAPSGMDFDEFSFSDEPAAPQTEFVPPPAGDVPDFGEVAFDQQMSEGEPASTGQQSVADDFDFGEIPFSEEPAAVAGESAATEPVPASEGGSLDFSNFDFTSEEPAYAAAPTEPEPSAPSDFDFSFASEESSPEAEGGETPLRKEELPGDIAEESFSFGTVEGQDVAEPSPDGFTGSFGGELPLSQDVAGDELQTAANEGFESFGSVLGEEPAPPVADDQLFSFSADAPETDESAGAAKEAAEMEPLDFGDLDFGGLAEKSPPAPPKSEGVNWEMPVAATAVAAGAAVAAAGALHSKGGAVAAGEEELPPLSIASRRKGSSIVSIALIAIAVLIVVAIAGLGFYVYQEGPAALKKVGLGFAADWFGMTSKEEGAIAIRNSSASFVTNQGVGELFVITGEAVNNYKKPRASIQVKVSVFGSKGEVLLQRTAYCGNTLTKEQLATLPMDKIDAAMNNQFGDSLANLGVEPGKAIPFVAVFKDLPRNAGEFGVEVVNSTVASK